MTPRASKILWSDWPALMCAVAVPVVWVVGLAFPILRPNRQFDVADLLAVAVPVSLLAAGVLTWRLHRIRRFFVSGQPVRGRILSVSITRDRGRVDFAYDFAGNTHRSWTPVHKNRHVLALRPDQEVDVLVDPSRPTRAIIRDLYL